MESNNFSLCNDCIKNLECFTFYDKHYLKEKKISKDKLNGLIPINHFNCQIGCPEIEIWNARLKIASISKNK